MKINSWNEWDQLKTIIIGRADNARIPIMDRSLHAINYADVKSVEKIISGIYPKQVIDEANEDLETLCAELKKLNINVLRPNIPNTEKKFGNGHWESDGYYNFCPRDSILVHGSTIIETPMPLRARYNENENYGSIFINALKDSAKWISAPKPQLKDDLYNLESVDRDTLTLRNEEPCFDAANVLRCGKDLFYLVSNSGNELGYRWLQSTLGSEFNVHPLKGIYSYMHVDSTISFLRPGLVLLNPERINLQNIPEKLKSWDHIWCPAPVDIGFYGSYKHASPWIGMNLLMVNQQLAIVEENQKELIELLKKYKIESLPLPMRHARTLGGAFHCVSLDLEREGHLENYF